MSPTHKEIGEPILQWTDSFWITKEFRRKRKEIRESRKKSKALSTDPYDRNAFYNESSFQH